VKKRLPHEYNILLNNPTANILFYRLLIDGRLALLRTLFGSCSTLVRLFCDSYKVEQQSENSRRRYEGSTSEVRGWFEGKRSMSRRTWKSIDPPLYPVPKKITASTQQLLTFIHFFLINIGFHYIRRLFFPNFTKKPE
jgi:hypothetical protein